MPKLKNEKKKTNNKLKYGFCKEVFEIVYHKKFKILLIEKKYNININNNGKTKTLSINLP